MNGEIAEPATPLRNYNLLVPEKKSYFREFQPEKQLSFLSLFLSLSLSLHGQDYLPTGLWTGNNYQSLENPSRKKELKTKKEKERKKRKTLLFHDCDYDSRLIYEPSFWRTHVSCRVFEESREDSSRR